MLSRTACYQTFVLNMNGKMNVDNFLEYVSQNNDFTIHIIKARSW